MQYVDDSFLVLPTEDSQLTPLKGILQTFAASAGLEVNFSKSSLVEINVNDQELSFRLSSILGCCVGSLPFP